jgi:TnpA family transposase
LLHYIADPELRGTIQAAMNKSEQFHAFLKWLALGGEEIRTNDREQQHKIVKYQHLVANLQIFHNVMQLTRIVKELRVEGLETYGV